MFVDQFLADRERLRERSERLGSPAGFRKDDSIFVIALGQVALEGGDGGVGLRQHLTDRECPREGRRRLGQAAHVVVNDADVVFAAGKVNLVGGDGRLARTSGSRSERASWNVFIA